MTPAAREVEPMITLPSPSALKNCWLGFGYSCGIVKYPELRRRTTLRVGDITMNLLTRQVWVGDRLVELSAREFLLAEMFLPASHDERATA